MLFYIMVGFISITGYRRVESGISTTNTDGYATVYFQKPFNRPPSVHISCMVSSSITLVTVSTTHFVVFGGSLITNYAGSHSHGMSGGDHTHVLSIATGGAHTHTGSVTTVYSHIHSIGYHYADVFVTGTWSYRTGSVQSCATNVCFYASVLTDVSDMLVSSQTHTHPIGSAGAHTHTVTIDSGGSHTHSGTMSSQDHYHICYSAGSHSHIIVVSPGTISFRWVAIEW